MKGITMWLLIFLLLTGNACADTVLDWTRDTGLTDDDIVWMACNPDGTTPSNCTATLGALETYFGAGGISAVNWAVIGGDINTGNWQSTLPYIPRGGVNWADANLFPTGATGNIGIGSPSPSAKLVVVGNGTSTVPTLNLRASDGSLRATFLDNGNIGIGTASPTAQNANYIFHIFNNANSNRALALTNKDAGTSAVSRFELVSSDSNGFIQNSPTNYSVAPAWAGKTLLYNETGSGVIVGSAGGSIQFMSGATERMRISGANVGIGSATPSAKLVIVGSGATSATTAFQVRDSALANKFMINDAGNVGVGSASPGTAVDVVGTVRATAFEGDGSLLSGVGTASGWTDGGTSIYNTTSSDNVGIGTSLPDFKLVVGSNNVVASDAPLISLGSSFSTSAPRPDRAKIITYYDSGTPSQSYGIGVSSLQQNYYVGASNVSHVFFQGSTELMRIQGDGNVGIGTSNIQGRFQVLPPTTSVIAGGGTITANGCGTVKPISSASSVTTSTSNTFTTPATKQAGCCMRVVNVNASDTITLDNNANFKSAGAADVVLGSYDTIEVCSDGTTWFQMGDTGNN